MTSLPSLIAECKKMLGEISPWPWQIYEADGYSGCGVLDCNDGKIPNLDIDIPFIASAPQTIETLVKALEEAKEVIKSAFLFSNEECSDLADDWLEKWGVK